MPFLRYPIDDVVTSTQNGFVDLLDWLGFLCATDYLVDVLTKVHQLTAAEAKKRAKLIVPHVRIARGYIEQSLQGPQELSFLPAYYAILNLSKVYILFGARHSDLKANRWHGANYDVHRKDSHNILTEVITLHHDGVFPLFYETLTGQAAPKKKFNLMLKQVLPCVSGISNEFMLATGKAPHICALQFGIEPPNRAMAIVLSGFGLPSGIAPPPWQTLTVPCLAGFTPSASGVPNQLVGGVIANPADFAGSLSAVVKRHLILRRRDPNPNLSWVLLGHHKIEFAEEIPIWLLFFYMSSIVRYKPEFFSRLKDSKYWPPISAARLHAFLDFLLAFWSFVHRKNCFIVAP